MAKKVVSFRIDENKLKLLQDYVRANNLNLSAVICASITKYLEEKGVIRCRS